METSEGNEGMFESKSLPENYCIIEGRNSVVDFADMQVEEIAMNIESRRRRRVSVDGGVETIARAAASEDDRVGGRGCGTEARV